MKNGNGIDGETENHECLVLICGKLKSCKIECRQNNNTVEERKRDRERKWVELEKLVSTVDRITAAFCVYMLSARQVIPRFATAQVFGCSNVRFLFWYRIWLWGILQDRKNDDDEHSLCVCVCTIYTLCLLLFHFHFVSLLPSIWCKQTQKGSSLSKFRDFILCFVMFRCESLFCATFKW